MIKEIAVFISAKKPFWVIDTNFFAGHIPAKTPAGAAPPDRALFVLEDAGGRVYAELPDRIDKAVQLLNRDKNYMVARGDAYDLYEVLHGTFGWLLPVLISGVQYIAETITAYSAPAPIGQDDKERYQFSTNYLWIIQRYY